MVAIAPTLPEPIQQRYIHPSDTTAGVVRSLAEEGCSPRPVDEATRRAGMIPHQRICQSASGATESATSSVTAEAAHEETVGN